MSIISDAIQAKCLAFGDRVIKLNDYLLKEAANAKPGANNAEACNGISKADFKSKSFIALKEARESLYWIELLHRNNFIDDRQYESIYGDCEELVKVLHHRCKKINDTE